MTKSITFFCMLTSIASFSATFAWSAPSNWPKLKPGLIETNMTMDGKAMPPMKTCITEALMKESEKMGEDHEKKSCTGQQYKQSGNTYFVEMKCKDENDKPMPISMVLTVASANEFHMKTTSIHHGKPMKMEQTTKRLGDCDGKDQDQVLTKDGKEISMEKLMEQIKKSKNIKMSNE